MERKLKILFTSDVHGCFTDTDYATGLPCRRGICRCMPLYEPDGNTLILDGGDVLQGSPLTYFMHKPPKTYEPLAAAIFNLAGYRFVTLGNHDFNYGRETLEAYLAGLDAVCLSANVQGVRGTRRTAVATLQNGLRVGLTGITTHFVNVWERPEHLQGVTVTDAFEGAKAALEELRAQGTDLNVCIYHGGFENDVASGKKLSDTGENQGWRICTELGYDVLFTGHQHNPLSDLCISGTYTCQAPHNAAGFIEMHVSVSEAGAVSASSRIRSAGDTPDEKALALFADAEKDVKAWLDRPVGQLDLPLQPESHLRMALFGSPISNFFNQVQLEASGADISSTCLPNEVQGLEKTVTIRNIVSAYIYPNTLKVIEVRRNILKAALERCAEYFTVDGSTGRISDAFTVPKAEHYNYDYFSGITVRYDLTRPVGDRVRSIRYHGSELPEDLPLRLCLNNYRATGTGGYPLFASCPVLWESQTEIVELIMDYVEKHGSIQVDPTRWIRVAPADLALSE